MADLNYLTLKKIPENYLKYDSIIGEPFYVNQFRFTKFIKRNLKKMILNPKFLLKKIALLNFTLICGMEKEISIKLSHF